MNELKNMLSGGNDPFMCGNCHKEIPVAFGSSKRNHCPYCLYSKHLDDKVPGDRSSNCQKLMSPSNFEMKHGMWRVLHSCKGCGKEVWNKLLLDDKILSDNVSVMQKIMEDRAFRS